MLILNYFKVLLGLNWQPYLPAFGGPSSGAKHSSGNRGIKKHVAEIRAIKKRQRRREYLRARRG